VALEAAEHALGVADARPEAPATAEAVAILHALRAPRRIERACRRHVHRRVDLGGQLASKAARVQAGVGHDRDVPADGPVEARHLLDHPDLVVDAHLRTAPLGGEPDRERTRVGERPLHPLGQALVALHLVGVCLDQRAQLGDRSQDLLGRHDVAPVPSLGG